MATRSLEQRNLGHAGSVSEISNIWKPYTTLKIAPICRSALIKIYASILTFTFTITAPLTSTFALSIKFRNTCSWFPFNMY